MRQTKALSKSSFAFADGPLQTINVDLSYADYLHDEKDPGGAVLSTFKSKEGDGRVEALFGQMGFVSAAALGLQAQNRRFSALGEAGDFLSPTLTQSEAAFAFAEAPLGARANVQAAARVERVDVKGTPASGAPAKRNFTPVSGSLGALFDITEALKLGLTISSAARAPGQVELFAHGPHDGPGTFETGDPDLKIERSNSIEATLRVRRQRLHVDGSVWAAQFDNYVFGNLTGRTCDDTGACVPDDSQELKELFYAQADARFWGAEGKATLNVIENEAGALNANLLADYVRAKFTHGGGDVPRIQPYRVGGGLSWTSEAFDAGFLLIYVGKQDKVPVGDTVTKGYVSLDAQAAWRPLANNDRFEIALSGRNLTDDVQRNAVALNRDLVVLPGRDVRLVLRERF
jgi:iron complex outermembrane receptor protein